MNDLYGDINDIIQEELGLALDEKRKKKKKKKKKKSGKKDACYHKVKARYDVWPSAYASGAGALQISLRDWFGRKGAKGKKGGWVDCNTCRKDKKTGRKKCSACGRSGGEKRSKYPSCRPTPSACGKRGKWGKKSKRGKKG